MMITSGQRPSRVRVADEAEFVRINHANVCEEAKPGFGPAERLEEMEREGVVGAVLIDNAVVTQEYLEIEAENAWCRIVNDWVAETYEGYLDRFAPGIHLPLRDIPAAVAELERAAGMGLRPAVLPDALWASPYSLPEWEPLWEAGSAVGSPSRCTSGVPGSRTSSTRILVWRPCRVLLDGVVHDVHRHGGDPRLVHLLRAAAEVSRPDPRHDRGVRRLAGLRHADVRPSLGEPLGWHRPRPDSEAEARRAAELLPATAGKSNVYVGSRGGRSP